jgi:hypothetical protein
MGCFPAGYLPLAVPASASLAISAGLLIKVAGPTHEIRRLKAALRQGAHVYRCTRIEGMASN